MSVKRKLYNSWRWRAGCGHEYRAQADSERDSFDKKKRGIICVS